jgi:SNF2 family DNA or RNA helicase
MTLTLYEHQRLAVETLRKSPRFCLWWEMGTGKTLAVLSAIHAIGGKTVVVCPKSVVDAAWARDAEHYPAMRTVAIKADAKAKRQAAIAGDWDIAVCGFDMFRIHAKDFEAAGIRRLVIDESSRCKNPKAQITQAAQIIGDRVQSVWMLSGTAAPNCPSEYVPQMRIVSRDVFGGSYWGAINRYFIPVKRKVKGREIIERFTQTAEQRARFQERLRAWSWTLKREECIDLPDTIDKIVEVELGDEARAYRAAEKELVLILDSGERTSIKAEAALIKLRQIIGGSVKVEGVSQVVGDSKLQALAEVLDEIGPEPCVIWAEFRHEIERIEAMIRERGESVARIDGETSHFAGETAAAFQRGDISRLICHPASAGHGITLTRGKYAIYYSLSFSLEQHDQSRARIHRIGQTRGCVYTYLMAQDTVDRAMLAVLKRKRSVSAAMSEALKRKWKTDNIEADESEVNAA